MAIIALGYLGVRSDRLDDWSDFAGRLLGMQKIDRGGKALAFRMDDMKQRLVVSDEPGETLAFMGWEVAEAADLDRYAARLEAAGVAVTWGSRSLADRRLVTDLITFADPRVARVAAPAQAFPEQDIVNPAALHGDPLVLKKVGGEPVERPGREGQIQTARAS